MSEYQYYEFQAIDQPLTDKQMRELRSYSSRAVITPVSFVNEYNWGNFKGNTDEWIEKYFDAFLYVANWGTHLLEFRMPLNLFEQATLAAYCTDECMLSYVKGEYVIVCFASEEEAGNWEEGADWLALLRPLRGDLMNGDYRSFYLGWLAALQAGEVEDDAIEPPVPPGLGSLNAPLQELANFLRIDTDLIDAAAEKSSDQPASTLSAEDIALWVAKMPDKEKDAVIATLIEGERPHLGQELRRRILHEREAMSASAPEAGQRTVLQLTACAETRAEERRQKEEEIRARAKAKREQEQAEARKRHLESLVGKEQSLWSKVDAHIATRQPKRYDEAVATLHDLRALAAMSGQESAFASRVGALCRKHARKPSLLKRIQKAHLTDGDQ